MSSIYPADEFEYPDPDMPVGSHRRPPSKWRPVLPFLIILAVVPLLAWGFSALLQRGGTGEAEIAQSAVTPQVSQSEDIVIVEEEPVDESGQPSAAPDDPADTPDKEPAADAPTESETKDEQDADEPDFGTSILVLNETEIDGYAAQVAQTIADGGFTNTAADNTFDWITQVNTVFYSTEDEAATAEKVAELAGITDVVLNADATGGSGIVVLLVY